MKVGLLAREGKKRHKRLLIPMNRITKVKENEENIRNDADDDGCCVRESIFNR